MSGTQIMEFLEHYRKYNCREDLAQFITRMQPLVQKYAYKMAFMEREDATQELNIVLLEAIRNMRYCNCEGECINYLKKSLYSKYCYNWGKYYKEMKVKDPYAEITEEVSGSAGLGYVETILDMQNILKGMRGKSREIAEDIIHNQLSDSEIAEKTGVSRQYVNRIRNKIYGLYYN